MVSGQPCRFCCSGRTQSLLHATEVTNRGIPAGVGIILMSSLDLRVTGCRLSLISTYHPFHGNRALAGAFQIHSSLRPQGRFWPAGCELFLPSQRVVLESPCFLPSLCPLDWRLEQPRWLQREGSYVFRGWICFTSKCNLLLDCYRRETYISVLFKAL